MDLNHLHLHVRDLARSRRFYEEVFGFRERIRHGEVLFLENDDGFDLALAPDPEPARLPAWFHFGFRVANPGDVRALHASLGARAGKLLDEPDFVTFRVEDPDGHRIEVYWEP